MATEKWIAGSGQGIATWGTVMPSADLNSMPNASSVLSSCADIDNSSNLDMFADLSLSLSSGITPAAPQYIGVYLYTLNQDGTTYGDDVFTGGTQSTVTPSASLYVGSIILTTAAVNQTGMLQRIVLPPGKFRFLLQNQSGVTLAASSNTVKYRTYNRSVA